MSAEAVALAVQRTALAAVDGLNGVYVREPPRGGEPYALIEPVIGGEWGAKDRRGRELRIAWRIMDRGPEPGRVEALADAAEATTLAMPRDPGGWRIVTVVLLRARLAPTAEGWAASREFRLRMMEEL